MEKGEIYKSTTIEAFAIRYEYKIEYIGDSKIGSDFLVLVNINNTEEVISFILVGHGEDSDYDYYECIFCKEEH